LKTLAILPEKIINIGPAKFYVPNYPTDFIQSEIVDDGTFYEIDVLEKLQPYIKKNAVILDIGANIGNHSVYWAVKSNAKRIYSFEPVKDFFKILKKNVEINDLNNKIKIFNIGLSNKKINGSISFYDRKNIGGTRVRQNPNGNLLLDKLDNIKIKENAIDFVKIDVEGHELEVLQGARETLIKYKPVIFIETFRNQKSKVHEYLTNLGYRLEKSFICSNYLYVFNQNHDGF
jgi:FkbM family methyltransferase